LAKRIYELEVDGLVWNKEPKLVEVAYGMKMLRIACVIEDDKVMIDDLYERI